MKGWGQKRSVCPSKPREPKLLSAAEKRGLWEGVVQEPLRRALFCGFFLCSEVIFSCKSHRNFFQKLPLQCRHFLENPLAKNPKTQLLILGRRYPGILARMSREFQVTVCGVTVSPFSRRKGNQRPKLPLKQGSNASVTKLPFQ